MSLQTLEKQASWLLITKDKLEVFLTAEEYEVCNELLNHPEARFLTFDDGSIAIADIRRIEKLPTRIKEEFRLGRMQPVLTKDEAEIGKRKLEEMRAKYPFLKKK